MDEQKKIIKEELIEKLKELLCEGDQGEQGGSNDMKAFWYWGGI